MANLSPTRRNVGATVNVQPIFKLNETEAAFAAAYRRGSESLPGSADTGLRALRDQAIARFEATGLPHRRQEFWHYTDLRRILRELPEIGETGEPISDLAGEPLGAAFAALEPHRIVFVDGVFAADLSDLGSLPSGVEVSPLSAGAVANWAVDMLSAFRPVGDHAVFDLNTALMADGALIRISGGVQADRPILILHLGRVGGTRHLRHAVLVEAGASATIIEAHGGVASGDGVTTASAIWSVGDGARVDYIKVQQAGLGATHLAPHVAEIGAGATFNAFALTLGAGLSREERHVNFVGEGASSVISGAYILDGSQHADTTLVVNHAAPGSTSQEFYRGIIDGEAQGVFQGRIIVALGAQKTDARQSVDALLLSEGAEHHAKPELEIYADDVQCGHGATCGELDPHQLFYLRARGLPATVARQLLIAAFARECLETIAHNGVREVLIALADERLVGLGQGGSDA